MNLITVNNVKYTKIQVIREIKSHRSASFHNAETIRNAKNKIVSERIHFAAPKETAFKLQEFFNKQIVKKDSYTYYIEFERSLNYSNY